jgi:hypothetical protein
VKRSQKRMILVSWMGLWEKYFWNVDIATESFVWKSHFYYSCPLSCFTLLTTVIVEKSFNKLMMGRFESFQYLQYSVEILSLCDLKAGKRGKRRKSEETIEGLGLDVGFAISNVSRGFITLCSILPFCSS